MDKLVSARCFRVSEPEDGTPDLPDIMLAAMNLSPGERECEVDTGVTLRLERCAPMGQILVGEFCRKQTENVPPYANQTGLSPMDMPDGHGIGHVAAFLYHRPTRIIALQSNRQSATTGRISSYLMRRNPGSVFLLEAVLRQDAFARLNGRSLKKVHVRFASPENLEVLEREGVAIGRAAKDVADTYGAESIEITITAQRADRSAHLNNRAPTLISRLLRGDIDVEKLDVKALTEDGIDTVDLLQEQVRFSAELDLPEADPEAHFRARTSWLDEQFRARLPALEAQFALRRDGHQI